MNETYYLHLTRKLAALYSISLGTVSRYSLLPFWYELLQQ